MDGVVADFSTAYRNVEARLFPEQSRPPSEAPARRSDDTAQAGLGTVEDPAVREEAEAASDATNVVAGPTRSRRRRDAIWREIESISDFWMTLEPIEDGIVRRIHALMLQHRWEVFFITQRPATAGDTVQRQTQRWLVEQGFDLPSVLVLGGSRGAAAGALRLDYHVDDSPQNCIDVISDSRAKPILIVPDRDPVTMASARKLRIGVARTVAEAIVILEQASVARTNPTLLDRLAALVGWK
jgi:hypothetical protein